MEQKKKAPKMCVRRSERLRDMRRRGWGVGGNGCREGDGERSSLGNLFWSTQSTDTQGAGKPITV